MNKSTLVRGIILSAFAATSALSAQTLTVMTTQKSTLVKIYGLTISDNKINLQFMSTGCTNNQSFALNWQEDQLQVLQIKTDHCRRMPHKIWLSFKIPAQQNKFTLANPFAS